MELVLKLELEEQEGKVVNDVKELGEKTDACFIGEKRAPDKSKSDVEHTPT